MTIKKLMIALVTIIALFPVVLALVNSVSQPQVQSNLQLYQTNIILQAAELSSEPLNTDQDHSTSDSALATTVLLGNNPYATAENQYIEVQKLLQENIDDLQEKLTQSTANPLNKTRLNSLSIAERKEIEKQIVQEENFLRQIELRLGIIKAKQEKLPEAEQIWDGLIKQSEKSSLKPELLETATVLKSLWENPPVVTPGTEATINAHLKGWFRNTALKQLYQVEGKQEALATLQNESQEKATQALTKLALVGGLPIMSGLFGVVIIILLMTQLLLKGKTAILANNADLAWDVPWNWEVIWLVLIVGFFFVGQIILPLVFGLGINIFKLNIAILDLRYKAIYVLVSYLAMAITGILVLYFAIKRFFPLPKDWFQFNGFSNWILWGLGGYFVAFPLVVVVSLINQQIWQGKGGSNPLLSLALESQDKLALMIFFITASFAAPFFEEIIFRGFLLPSLTKYISVWGAIVVSAFIFALAHLNLSEVLPLAMLGIILGFVYTRSRNLLSSMLLHSLWNSGTLVSLFVLGSGNN